MSLDPCTQIHVRRFVPAEYMGRHTDPYDSGSTISSGVVRRRCAGGSGTEPPIRDGPFPGRKNPVATQDKPATTPGSTILLARCRNRRVIFRLKFRVAELWIVSRTEAEAAPIRPTTTEFRRRRYGSPQFLQKPQAAPPGSLPASVCG